MSEIVVFGGGCFWGVEDLIRKLEGVIDTEVGYCGGEGKLASYLDVKKGQTGHAECVQVEFDSKIMSLSKLLGYFFRLHDPTTVNRQGNDVGSQYRSVIFYQNDEQKQVVESVIAELNRSRVWPRPVVTQVVAAMPFYSAEEHHQDYLQKNPGGYTCHFWRG